MVAYPTTVKLPYRVGRKWLEERTLAGEIVQARHELEIDLDRLDDSHRAAATELAKTLDFGTLLFSTAARTATIVGSAINPAVNVDKDFIDTPILRRIGGLPVLPEPVENPAALIDAWVDWVAAY